MLERPMRNPVACVACRSAKQKCIHNDAPPCDRCKASGKGDQCHFPPPGTSAIHRRPKRPRLDSEFPPHSVAQSSYRASEAPGGTSPSNTASQAQANVTGATLEGLDPFDLLTDEVKNSYLRCGYKWSFHHTPTLLLRIRDRTLEPWMAWAILALAIRFVKEPPLPFKTQTDASNAFAAHARQILQSDLETPSISRVQALLMLTGHDWGAGNGRRAWIYLGMAIRLVEVMDLCQEPALPKDRLPTRDEFIDAEIRRRTAWTCFLMDSLLSGGKGRKRSLEASDMNIQLPCERESFVFGEPVCTEQLDGRLRMPALSLPVGELGIIAYSMRAANIWGKVARWACSDVINAQLPWSSASQFQGLIRDLEEWKKTLPTRLQYDLFALHSHNAVDQGQAFCYMHCIHFMSYMFLHRAYLPVLGPHTGADEASKSYSENKDAWKSWQKTCRTKLFKEATMVLDMLEEMRTFGVYFLRGLVPWIGFTIYTAVGVMLYSYNFPSAEEELDFAEKAKSRVIQGSLFLKEMKQQWPMAETWFETIKRMQAYYKTVHSEDGPISPDERQALKTAMIDYGALQPSPVQKQEPPPASEQNSVLQQRAPQPALMSPPSTTPNYTFSFVSPVQQPFLFDGDDSLSFDINFNFSNADMEAMMMSATQDFWGSFPGEVGVGYI
ncbi:hypothetical protein GQ43DRAFT_398433 [Delitschia confertaspora ATCC 74209]|uniref:Zn(2)-C6 fungal-type domain-containing protein n=1 Tax=Delitschia confertaspora ATCC 74209 TaxID=1513339 RepID=A0A9P4JML6_9PLEO|nr:hypothetical protein GQ43DRAFT_398433 [Delitschia confertaspora ATCC 74209]